jgi:hypothetical protein
MVVSRESLAFLSANISDLSFASRSLCAAIVPFSLEISFALRAIWLSKSLF